MVGDYPAGRSPPRDGSTSVCPACATKVGGEIPTGSVVFPAMAVTVRIPTTMRPLAGGNSTVQVDGSTLAEVLTNLNVDHPASTIGCSTRPAACASSSTCSWPTTTCATSTVCRPRCPTARRSRSSPPSPAAERAQPVQALRRAAGRRTPCASFGPSSGSGGRLSRSCHTASTRLADVGVLRHRVRRGSRLKLRKNARITTASLRIAGTSPSRKTPRMNVRGSVSSASGSSPARSAVGDPASLGVLLDRRPVPRIDLGAQRGVVRE